MKIGQVLSTIELPGLSEEGQAEFRAALAQLRDNAPTFGFDDIRKVVEGDLGGKISDHFAEFEREAFAAASIGQVHRAPTHDGERGRGQGPVPGSRRGGRDRPAQPPPDPAAGQADGAGARREGGRGRDPRADLRGARLRARGAEPPRARARVPRATRSRWCRASTPPLGTRRVLTPTSSTGPASRTSRRWTTPTRDRYGEIVFRFFFDRERTLMVLGDPHPGNYLLLADGRVGFLDFGMVRRVPAEHLGRERALAGRSPTGTPPRSTRCCRSSATSPIPTTSIPTRCSIRSTGSALALRARLPAARPRLRPRADRAQRLAAQPPLRGDEAADAAARLAADAPPGGADLHHPRRPARREPTGRIAASTRSATRPPRRWARRRPRSGRGDPVPQDRRRPPPSELQPRRGTDDGTTDFTEEEWKTILQGPTSAGMHVIVSDRGGAVRETMEMARAYPRSARTRAPASSSTRSSRRSP